MRYRINRTGGREESFLCVGLGVVLTPMYLQGRWDNQIKSLPRLSTFACQRKNSSDRYDEEDMTWVREFARPRGASQRNQPQSNK